MKVTDEMVNAADSVLSRVRPGINDGQIRLALEAAFAVRAKYTREQINEMIGRGEMFVDTNPEADWIAASEMACPHCGGSGHKDDVRPLSASPAGVVKPQCCMCGKKGLSTVEGDGGAECELSDGRWVCSAECWDRAVEPAGVGVETPPPSSHTTGPQDISTAPKMTDVLVWWPIVQLDEHGEPTEEVVDGRWIISEDQGGYWIEPDVMNAIGDHLGDDFTYAAKPSHWMPLPAPLFVPAEDQP